ncbi:MAG: hypothetical protein SGI84_00470 [Gemmatimonadota bacterium]|nr:hypothetical protein [Gemmatimonadota bacterium]
MSIPLDLNNLDDLIALPWTIVGPKHQTDEHGNAWWEMRVGELPEFFVAGADKDEVIREYRGALRAFLESYTAAKESVPGLPAPLVRAWQFGVEEEPSSPVSAAILESMPQRTVTIGMVAERPLLKAC